MRLCGWGTWFLTFFLPRWSILSSDAFRMFSLSSIFINLVSHDLPYLAFSGSFQLEVSQFSADNEHFIVSLDITQCIHTHTLCNRIWVLVLQCPASVSPGFSLSFLPESSLMGRRKSHSSTRSVLAYLLFLFNITLSVLFAFPALWYPPTSEA